MPVKITTKWRLLILVIAAMTSLLWLKYRQESFPHEGAAVAPSTEPHSPDDANVSMADAKVSSALHLSDSPPMPEVSLSGQDNRRSFSEELSVQSDQAEVNELQNTTPPQRQGDAENSAQVPVHWRLIVRGPLSERSRYKFASDFETVWNGIASASLTSTMRTENVQSASMVQIASAELYRGKRIRYAAQVRTRRAASDFRASMWLRVQDSNGLVVAYQNTNDRMIRGNSDWSEQSIVLDVPQDASVMLYGIFGVGTGTLWIDDVRISPVERTVALTAAWSGGNGVMNLAIHLDRALIAPTNLDFEQTEAADESVYWRERDQPDFR